VNERLPETPVELFDMCHRLFGIGSYDEYARTDPPWFLAADYCHRHGIAIQATGELISYIAPALVEYREQQSLAKAHNLYDRINRAAQVAIEQGNAELAAQITRIPYPAAAEALPPIEEQLGITS
jgi:hypothetical protein